MMIVDAILRTLSKGPSNLYSGTLEVLFKKYWLMDTSVFNSRFDSWKYHKPFTEDSELHILMMFCRQKSRKLFSPKDVLLVSLPLVILFLKHIL
jgi:hypothetical protein